MSDWAARLSQKPTRQTQTTTHGNPSNSEPTGISGISGISPNIHSHKPRPSKPINMDSPVKSGSVSPEPFNAAEILEWANSRYNADLEQARGDKSGDNIVVYRSLESSSSWKTKGPGNGRKNAKDDGRFDLLSEINRNSQTKSRK